MCKILLQILILSILFLHSVINYFIVTKSANFSTDVTKGEAELTADMLQT